MPVRIQDAGFIQKFSKARTKTAAGITMRKLRSVHLMISPIISDNFSIASIIVSTAVGSGGGAADF